MVTPGYGIMTEKERQAVMVAKVTGKYIFSTAETAEFMGVSEIALRKWAKRGCPKAGYGRFDLREVLRWREQAEENDGRPASPEARKMAAIAELKEIQAKQEALSLESMRGRYVSRQVLQGELLRLKNSLLSSLGGVRQRVLDKSGLVGMPADAAAVVVPAVDNAFNEITEDIKKAPILSGRLAGKEKKSRRGRPRKFA